MTDADDHVIRVPRGCVADARAMNTDNFRNALCALLKAGHEIDVQLPLFSQPEFIRFKDAADFLAWFDAPVQEQEPE